MGPPAEIALTASPQSASGGNLGTVALGSYFPDRKTIVVPSGRSDATSGNMGATLDAVPMTHIITQYAFGGNNPAAIFILDTGEGTSFEAVTSATLIVTAPLAVQRSAAGVWHTRYLSSLVPADSQSSTADNASMTIAQYEGGITIAGGYVGDDTDRTWANLTNSQTVQIPSQFTNNPLGWEASTATDLAAVLTLSPSPIASAQRGFVSATWRGESNP